MMNLFREMAPGPSLISPVNAFENAPSRRESTFARGVLRDYDPSVNYRELREQLHQSENNSSARSHSSLSQQLENNNQTTKDLFAKISEQAQFKLSHPMWQEEVQECFDQDLYYKLVHISKGLGMLGVLLFTRLCTFYKMSVSKSARDRKQGQEQMSFNQSNKGGIPANSENFLVYVSERMMNIVAKMANNNEFKMESKPIKMQAQSLDC
jgi:hypothetical protein